MRRLKKLTTAGVVRIYSKRKKPPKLTLTKLDRDTVLIEDDATALEFFGEFVLAHSRAHEDDCGRSLSPKAAGNAWFTKASTLGFYLHKLPCYEGKVFGKRLEKRRSRAK